MPAKTASASAGGCEPTKVADGDFDSPSIETALGAPSPARQHLRDCGIRYHAIYTNDLFGNVSGGITRGANDSGRLELGLQADLEKLVGWTGATFNATGFLIHGHGVTTDRLGNLLAVSNAEADPDRAAVRIVAGAEDRHCRLAAHRPARRRFRIHRQRQCRRLHQRHIRLARYHGRQPAERRAGLSAGDAGRAARAQSRPGRPNCAPPSSTAIRPAPAPTIRSRPTAMA